MDWFWTERWLSSINAVLCDSFGPSLKCLGLKKELEEKKMRLGGQILDRFTRQLPDNLKKENEWLQCESSCQMIFLLYCLFPYACYAIITNDYCLVRSCYLTLHEIEYMRANLPKSPLTLSKLQYWNKNCFFEAHVCLFYPWYLDTSASWKTMSVSMVVTWLNIWAATMNSSNKKEKLLLLLNHCIGLEGHLNNLRPQNYSLYVQNV